MGVVEAILVETEKRRRDSRPGSVRGSIGGPARVADVRSRVQAFRGSAASGTEVRTSEPFGGLPAEVYPHDINYLLSLTPIVVSTVLDGLDTEG